MYLTRGIPTLCVVLSALTACGDDQPSDPGPDDEIGSLEVTTVSTGEDLDGDGYTIQVNGAGSQAIGANASATLTNVAAGDHEVTLAGVHANCTVDGENPRTVTVTGGATATAQFDVACEDALIGQIAFHSDRDGNLEIYAMNRDGTGQVRLTEHVADDRDPAVSPDGTRIVFTSLRDGNPEIHVMNADGSEVVNLTNNSSSDNAGTWSPDGSRIAFSTDRNGDNEIFVMNADGTGAVNISDSPGSAELFPVWSPDGTRIVFVRFLGGTDTEIYVMDADGSGPINLTNHPATDGRATWSPDGSRIAFETDRDGNNEIFVMEADGSDPVNLTSTEGSDAFPSWSRDGDRIAFSSDGTGDREVFLVDPDGVSPVNLSNDPALDVPGPQAWGP